MGQLICKDNIQDASWYFADAHYSWESRRHIYQWPSLDFPYSVAMHSEDINGAVRVRIRRWIQLNLQETVLYDTIDKNYRIYYTREDNSWENSYEVRNSWHAFYFENEHSTMIFRLAFSDLVKEMTDHNPKYPEHEEMLKRK